MVAQLHLWYGVMSVCIVAVNGTFTKKLSEEANYVARPLTCGNSSDPLLLPISPNGGGGY